MGRRRERWGSHSRRGEGRQARAGGGGGGGECTGRQIPTVLPDRCPAQGTNSKAPIWQKGRHFTCRHKAIGSLGHL